MTDTHVGDEAIDLDQPAEDHDLGRMPGPDGGPRLANVWVYRGRAYDLTDWISKHPGGEFFIGRTKNRDITSIIGSYHRDPEKIERMLQKCAGS